MGRKRDLEYDLTKSLLESVRGGNVLLESDEDDSEDAIAITNDIKFGENVLEHQIDSFRQTVHPGAKFSEENADKPESNPLVFYPNTGNLVFSGSIPTLSGLKFQFSLNDVTSAPYIFVDGLAITEDVITTLNKLRGYYKNWQEEWLTSTDLLDKLKKKKKQL